MSISDDLRELHLHDHGWLLREGGQIAPRIAECVPLESGAFTDAWNHYNPEAGRSVTLTGFGMWTKAVRFDKLRATWLWFWDRPYLVNRMCSRCKLVLSEAMGLED